MTPERYCEIMDELGLGTSEIAHLLDIDKRVSRRYSNGEAPIPERIADWLESLLRTRPR
jgi:hypothetical protein